MKTCFRFAWALALFAWAWGFSASAEAAVTVRAVELNVCLPSTPGLPGPKSQPLDQNTVQACERGRFAEYEDNTANQPRVGDGDLVLVYVGSGSTTLGSAGVTAISYMFHVPGEASTDSPISCKLPNGTTFNDVYYAPCWLKTGSTQPSQNDTVEVVINAGAQKLLRYARFSKPLSLAGSAMGFWVPVGMFGTNLKSSEEGIPLAALPAGLAWGVQANVSGKDYIGISVFASWSITPQRSDDGGSTGDYNVASATAGAFFDFDGYVYAGYGFAMDFRSGYKNPGSMAVVGVGPKLLQVLKAQPE